MSEAGSGHLESEGLREAIGRLDRATREFTRSIEEVSSLAAIPARTNGAIPREGAADAGVHGRGQGTPEPSATLTRATMAEPIADADNSLAGLDRRLTELRERIESMHRSLAELDRARPSRAEPAEAPAQPAARQPERVTLAPGPATGADPVDHSAARLLPEHICRNLRILPIAFDGHLTLATAYPDDRLAQNVAYALTGRPLRTVTAAPDEIDAAIDRTFGESPESAVPSPAAPPQQADGRNAQPRGPADRRPESAETPQAAAPEATGERRRVHLLSPLDWVIVALVALGSAAGVAVAPQETAIALGTASLVIIALTSLYQLRAGYRERASRPPAPGPR